MLYILDYGAGNTRSLANTITKLGFEYKFVGTPEDIEKADVRLLYHVLCKDLVLIPSLFYD